MGLFSGIGKALKKIAGPALGGAFGFLTGGPVGAAMGALGGLQSSPRPQPRPGSPEAKIGNSGVAWSIGNALGGALRGLGTAQGGAAALQVLGGGLSDAAVLKANKASNKSTERINRLSLETQYNINRENRRAQSRANRMNVNLTREQNEKNRRLQSRINNINVAMQDTVNKRNVASQELINQRNIDLAREANSQAQKNWQVERSDSKRVLQDTVADALAAGINPLTAIRGGVTSGGGVASPSLVSPQLQAATEFASQIEATQGDVASVAAAQGFAPTLQAPQILPADSLGQALSDAGATLFASFANQPDPEREFLEKAILGEELKTRQRENLGVFTSIGGTVPVAASYTGQDYGSAVSVADGPAAVDPALRIGPTSPVTAYGRSAEDAEAFSGEVGGTLQGIRNIVDQEKFRYGVTGAHNKMRRYNPRHNEGYYDPEDLRQGPQWLPRGLEMRNPYR